MANTFVENLSSCFYREFSSSICHDDMQDAFNVAIQKLPKGKLRKQLRKGFDKYFSQFEKHIAQLSGTEVPSLSNSSHDDSLQELSSLEARKDVAETSHHEHKLVFNLLKPSPSLPSQNVMRDRSLEQKTQIYSLYVRQALARTDIWFEQLTTAVGLLEKLLLKTSGDCKSLGFTWKPIMDHLVQLSAGLSHVAVIRILRLLFEHIEADVDNCLLKEKPVRSNKLAKILQSYLSTLHMRVQHRDKDFADRTYCRYLSALLSYYVDLTCVAASRVEKKAALGRHLCGFVAYLLAPWPQKVLEVALQSSMLDPDHASVILPLLGKCVSLKPEKGDHEHYLKYVLVARQASDKLGTVEQVIEWTMATKHLAASSGFLDWVQEKCPESSEHLPVEDKKFKKSNITKYLLEEADDNFILLLIDSLRSPVSMVTEEDFLGPYKDGEPAGPREKTGDQEPDGEEDAGNHEALFFLDKAGDQSSNSKKKTPKKSIVVTTMEEFEDLLDVDMSDSSQPQTYRLDPALVEERFPNQEDKEFVQSGILSISKVTVDEAGPQKQQQQEALKNGTKSSSKESKAKVSVDKSEPQKQKQGALENSSKVSTAREKVDEAGPQKQQQEAMKKGTKSSSKAKASEVGKRAVADSKPLRKLDTEKLTPTRSGRGRMKELHVSGDGNPAPRPVFVSETESDMSYTERTTADGSKNLKSVVHKVSQETKAHEKVGEMSDAENIATDASESAIADHLTISSIDSDHDCVPANSTVDMEASDANFSNDMEQKYLSHLSGISDDKTLSNTAIEDPDDVVIIDSETDDNREPEKEESTQSDIGTSRMSDSEKTLSTAEMSDSSTLNKSADKTKVPVAQEASIDISSDENEDVTVIQNKLASKPDQDSLQFDMNLSKESYKSTEAGESSVSLTTTADTSAKDDTVTSQSSMISPRETKKSKRRSKASESSRTSLDSLEDKMENYLAPQNTSASAISEESSIFKEVLEDKDKETEMPRSPKEKNSVRSPREKTSKSVTEKFIEKAVKSKTPKKLKSKQTVVEADKGLAEESSAVSSRTKSTEEIVTIVEEIQHKLTDASRRASRGGKNADTSMFTDDSTISNTSVNDKVENEKPRKTPKKSSRSSLNTSDPKSKRGSEKENHSPVSKYSKTVTSESDDIQEDVFEAETYSKLSPDKSSQESAKKQSKSDQVLDENKSKSNHKSPTIKTPSKKQTPRKTQETKAGIITESSDESDGEKVHKSPATKTLKKQTSRKTPEKKATMILESSDESDGEKVHKSPAIKTSKKQTPRKTPDKKAEITESSDESEKVENIHKSPTIKTPSKKQTPSKTPEKKAEMFIESSDEGESEKIKSIHKSPTTKTPSNKQTPQKSAEKKAKTIFEFTDESDDEKEGEHVHKSPAIKTPLKKQTPRKTPGKKEKMVIESSDESNGEIVLEDSTKKGVQIKSPSTPTSARKLSNKTAKSPSRSSVDENMHDKSGEKLQIEKGAEKNIKDSTSPMTKTRKRSSELHSPPTANGEQDDVTSANKKKRLSSSEDVEEMSVDSLNKDIQELRTKRHSVSKLKTPVSAEKRKKLKSYSGGQTPTNIKLGSGKVKTPEKHPLTEDSVPSSQTKSPRVRSPKSDMGSKTPLLFNDDSDEAKPGTVVSDSEHEIEVPDIGKHLKAAANDEDDEHGISSPHIPNKQASKVVHKEDKKGTANKRRSLRPRHAPEHLEAYEVPVVEIKQVKSAMKTKAETKDDPIEEIGQLVTEVRSTKKAASGRKMTTIKEPEKIDSKSPVAKPSLRKLSASTSKKVVKKVEQLRTGRKRRLSSEFSGSERGSVAGDSTDSEITFPKVKKATAIDAKAPTRQSKRLSTHAPDTAAEGSQSRRYSLRKK